MNKRGNFNQSSFFNDDPYVEREFLDHMNRNISNLQRNIISTFLNGFDLDDEFSPFGGGFPGGFPGEQQRFFQSQGQQGINDHFQQSQNDFYQNNLGFNPNHNSGYNTNQSFNQGNTYYRGGGGFNQGKNSGIGGSQYNNQNHPQYSNYSNSNPIYNNQQQPFPGSYDNFNNNAATLSGPFNTQQHHKLKPINYRDDKIYDV